MGFFVRFWGTRGSIPTPGSATRRYGGNTACLEVRTDDTVLACDGGTGLRELGLDLQRRGHRSLDMHLFFSHGHWDHIQGFPFFVPAYSAANRLHVYGRVSGGRTVHALLSGQMESAYFPVRFADLGAGIVPGELTPDLSVGGVRVRTLEQNHPGGSLGYSFERDGHKVCYCTDSELDQQIEDPELPARDPAAQRSFPKEIVDFVAGADLLVADAQYMDHEYARRVGWGHPRGSTVVDLAAAAGVRRLALTHHDPMHTDEDVEAHVEACRERAATRPGAPEVFAAREWMELKIA